MDGLGGEVGGKVVVVGATNRPHMLDCALTRQAGSTPYWWWTLLTATGPEIAGLDLLQKTNYLAALSQF
jgi:hypothetical protein